MRRKLDWVEVLNEQKRWRSRAELLAWFSALIGRNVCIRDGTLDGFEEALHFMRNQISNLHFGDPVDLIWLDTQLKTVSLGVNHHQGAQPGEDSQLPLFRARVKGMLDTDLLRAVKDTLLIQFAEFVGQCLDNEACLVNRCEGIYRATNSDAAPLYLAEADAEVRWQAELRVFPEVGSESAADLHRCANLFTGSSKTRFCADTCRFATLQLTKLLVEPTYQPDKQRRFRRRADNVHSDGSGIEITN